MSTKRAEIEFVASKRAQNLDYLKRLFLCRDPVFWMNVCCVGKAEIAALAQRKQLQNDRRLRWFWLGLSLSPLQARASGTHFVHACVQLMEEFQFVCSNAAVQSFVRHPVPSPHHTSDR